MIATRIETDRLILKALEYHDAADLLAIFSDHEVMKYWNTEPWSTIEDANSFITDSSEAMEADKSITLGVYLKETRSLIGKVLLFNYDKESKRAEIGFGISRNFWGKGMIPEAGSALIEYAFHTLKLRRIEAEIDPDNTASARTLERLGFIKEGHLRQRWEINGVVSDSALYGLLADDLKSDV